ncbi:hypothetical protein [Streptomyces sp. NPDC017260]|uniref:hypothetical protein n=1 Tax=unclassified Streptomyces TaxID=2593676 RepID=UPI0037A1CDE2
MARYVLVAADGYSKEITGGPWDTDDPSWIAVPEGNRLMLEEEAFAAGYYYSPGGGAGVAPEQPDGADTDVQDRHHGQGRGHDKHDHGGHADQGPQAQEGGQGSQTQPGGQDQQ